MVSCWDNWRRLSQDVQRPLHLEEDVVVGVALLVEGVGVVCLVQEEGLEEVDPQDGE